MPSASVVIPAHNEQEVIERCLRVLLADAEPGEFEVLVACNGCTDRTAEIAGSFAGVLVLQTERASKAAALNLGDQTATAFPRVFLDADIELDTASARALVQALKSGTALAAAPTPVFQLGGRPLLVRAFYRAWQRSPYLRRSMIGSGVYAVSESGRSRFTVFPDLFGDDMFIRSLFDESERIAVAESTFVIRPPKRIRDLIAVRRRVYFGNAQVREQRPQGVESSDRSSESAFDIVRGSRSPVQAFDSVVYLAVCAVAKFQARRMGASSVAVTWDRDNSGRAT